MKSYILPINNKIGNGIVLPINSKLESKPPLPNTNYSSQDHQFLSSHSTRIEPEVKSTNNLSECLNYYRPILRNNKSTNEFNSQIKHYSPDAYQSNNNHNNRQRYSINEYTNYSKNNSNNNYQRVQLEDDNFQAVPMTGNIIDCRRNVKSFNHLNYNQIYHDANRLINDSYANNSNNNSNSRDETNQKLSASIDGLNNSNYAQSNLNRNSNGFYYQYQNNCSVNDTSTRNQNNSGNNFKNNYYKSPLLQTSETFKFLPQQQRKSQIQISPNEYEECNVDLFISPVPAKIISQSTTQLFDKTQPISSDSKSINIESSSFSYRTPNNNNKQLNYSSPQTESSINNEDKSNKKWTSMNVLKDSIKNLTSCVSAKSNYAKRFEFIFEK
jgi:hypothetical protein